MTPARAEAYKSSTTLHQRECLFTMAATEAPTGERRRSTRVLQRVSVRLAGESTNGERVNESAEAVVISAHGALVKTSNELRPGSDVEIEAQETQARARFHVIWATEKPLEGKWDMGVELNPGQKPPWPAPASA